MIAALIVSTAASAEPPARRVMLGVAGVVFASYPGSFEDPGPALVVGTPLWRGLRHRHFQWAWDGDVLAGFGTESKHVHVAVTPHFGFNLYLGSVFGFELRIGPAGILQAGEHTVVGLGGAGRAAYVFRFWDDDRRRLKLLLLMHLGGYFADDPGNDMGLGAAAMGVGLGYETPF